jgi:hypothetical protein
MNSRKAVAVPILIGLIGLMPVLRNPRFEMYHAVDVLQLLASGMCFGVALSAIVGLLRNKARDSR